MTERASVAVVTGGSRGIGAATCRRLAQDGFAVIVNYAGGQEAAADLVREITGAGGRAQAVQADVAESSDVRALFDAAEASFGQVTALVNNAGVMTLAPITQAN